MKSPGPAQYPISPNVLSIPGVLTNCSGDGSKKSEFIERTSKCPPSRVEVYAVIYPHTLTWERRVAWMASIFITTFYVTTSAWAIIVGVTSTTVSAFGYSGAYSRGGASTAGIARTILPRSKSW